MAAAALLLAPGDPKARQPLDLIERAQTLAPQRPELVWVHLGICERLKCKSMTQIAAHLQALDPDNGFAWASDLEKVPTSDSDAVTAVIARIGAAQRMTIYWNQLEVMMVDALAVASPSQDLATQGIYAIGILAAESIPPLQAISRACRPEQLDLPGRRRACEAMVARMEQSDTLLTQSLALSLQERWWPADSPQRDVLRAKRRQLDYLMTTSSRIPWWRRHHDMAVRIEAARSTAREEDVARAVTESRGLPLKPPVGWKDPRLWHVLERLRRALGDRMAYVFRHFPNERAHPGAELMSIASEAAARQGRFWEMHDAIYGHELPLDESILLQMASSLGLDMERFRRDLADPGPRRRVEEDLADGRRNGVTGTPTIFIDGVRYDGAWDFHSLLEALERPVGAQVKRSARAFANLPTSAGLVLLIAATAAVLSANSALAPLYQRLVSTQIGIGPSTAVLSLSVAEWCSEGLLAIFYLILGLEIRREMTAGSLADWRAAAAPALATLGSIAVPAFLVSGVKPGLDGCRLVRAG